MGSTEDNKDFFVSYTGADRAWAEWVAWVLEDEGCSVVIQAWDFHAGENFIDNMQKALEGTERTIAVLSAAYFDSEFCKQEWTAALAKAGKQGQDKLVPIRTADIDPPGLFAPIAYIDLFDTPEAEARKRLLAGIMRERAKPTRKGAFPGKPQQEKPRFPGALPAIWNVPHRNRHFTGREDLLEKLRTNLTAGTATVVTQSQAITGLGGIGKSELAVEFAYRLKDDYRLVWWLRAEDRTSLVGDYAALARQLDLPEKGEADQRVVVEAVRRWLRTNGDWLLIFDNAGNEASITDFVPHADTGHVIITSQHVAWDRIASPLPVDLWERNESVAFLRERTGEGDEQAANRLAEMLGDLPIALEQAAAYVGETRNSLAWYGDQLEKGHGAKLWARGRNSERTVAATWTLSFERVATESPAGAALLRLCAFLAPDNIPLDIIRNGAEHLPEPLSSACADDIDFEDSIGAALRYSLARRDGEALSVHRIVQAVTRDRLAEEERKNSAACAAKILNQALPSFAHGIFDVDVAAVYDRLLLHAMAAAEHADSMEVAPKEAARLFNEIGYYHWMRANLEAARQNFKRAQAIYEKTLGADHPNVATSINNVGLVLLDLGDLDSARDAFEGALAIDKKMLGPDHPNVGRDVNNVGLVLLELGKLDGARDAFEAARAIDEKTFGPDHPNVGRAVNNLGRVLRTLSDLDGARDAFEWSLAVCEKAFGADHPSVAIRLNNLGGVLQDLGDLDGARDAYERALAIDEKTFGPDHPNVATRVNNLGSVLRTLGDLDGARKAYERALEIFLKFLPEDHPNIVTVKGNLEALGR